MHLSIVLPCFNEEQNIAATVRDVEQWMENRHIEGEIIAVDDGSTDGTAAALDRLKNESTRLRIVHHEKNQGYGVAVRTGCDAAKTEWIAFMDSDGQFKAEDIALLLEHVDQYSFITGRRRKRADSPLRNAFGKILGVMNGVVLGLWVRDVNCGMKLFTGDVWTIVRPEYGVEKLFNTEVFLRLKMAGIPMKQVDVPHYPRRAGTPTGGSPRVILRMFRELFGLRWSMKRGRKVAVPSKFDAVSQDEEYADASLT